MVHLRHFLAFLTAVFLLVSCAAAESADRYGFFQRMSISIRTEVPRRDRKRIRLRLPHRRKAMLPPRIFSLVSRRHLRI